MAWIESHQELANHPKTKRFKRALGISTPQAIGHLHLLWWWALDYAQDGSLAAFSPDDLAEAAEYEGEGERFVDALVKSGFVDEDGMTIHDWDDYGSKFLKRREQSRIRQQRYRDEQGRYQSATNASVTRDKRSSNTVTGEERTRQDKTGEERPPKSPSRGTVNAPDPENVRVLTVTEKPPASQPYAAWAAYCAEAGLDITEANEDTKSRSCGLMRKLLEAGHTVDEIGACTGYLRSQTWRTSIISLKTLSQEIGAWKMAGKPAVEKARASPNGKPPTYADEMAAVRARRANPAPGPAIETTWRTR